MIRGGPVTEGRDQCFREPRKNTEDTQNRLMPTATSSGVSRLIQAYRGLKGAGRETQDSCRMLKVIPQGRALEPTLQPQDKWSQLLFAAAGCRGQARRMSCLLALRAIYSYPTKMTRHGHHDLETRHQVLQATSETSQTVLQWTVILLSNNPVTAAKTWSMDQWTEALFTMTRLSSTLRSVFR